MSGANKTNASNTHILGDIPVCAPLRSAVRLVGLAGQVRNLGVELGRCARRVERRRWGQEGRTADRGRTTLVTVGRGR